MLTVHLYRADFLTMLSLLSRISAGQFDLPLQQQPVALAVLMTYQRQLSLARIYAWESRRTNRTYKYNMPIPVAVTLFNELHDKPVTDYEQLLLDRLVEAMDIYQQQLQRSALSINSFHAAIR